MIYLYMYLEDSNPQPLSVRVLGEVLVHTRPGEHHMTQAQGWMQILVQKSWLYIGAEVSVMKQISVKGHRSSLAECALKYPF